MADKSKDKSEDEILEESGQFGTKIILPHKKDIAHNSVYLPPGHLSILIIGSSGSGKSTLLLELIPQIANLGIIVAATLIRTNPVYEQLAKWCERKEIRFELVDNPISCKETLESCISDMDGSKQGLIIFDDFSQQKSSRSDPYNQCVSMASAMLRNYGWHSCFITQSSTNVPTLYRNNANVRVIFAMNDVHAVRSICNDVLMARVVPDKETFMQLFDKIQKEYHSYLMVVTKGRELNLYIYLPSFGPEAPPRQVVINTKPNLKGDEVLAGLVEKYRSVGTAKDSYTSMMRRKRVEAIKKYIMYISKDTTESYEELLDQAMGVYEDLML